MNILLGPAGLGTPAIEGLKEIKKLGLTAAEVEFVYGIRMTNAHAKEIGDVARQLGISLSVHAPYYINLAAHEKGKVEASKIRILNSCERGHYLGAKYIVFHPAFYGKHHKETCYNLVKAEIVELQGKIKENNWDAVLCPETTGKKSQFGDVDELLRLSNETGCGLCVDFAHIEARNNGAVNYDEVCKKIKHVKTLTAHFAGIEYTERGERRHLITPENKLRDLLTAIKNNHIDIRIINESPDPVGDSLKAMRIWKML